MAHQQNTKQATLMQNSLKVGHLKLFSFLILSAIILLSNIALTFAQASDTPQEKSSNNKADQNLKSLATVNPSTLAMELSVPLMSYPGRNGGNLPVSFRYSSKIWRMDSQGTWLNTYGKYITDLRPLFAERSVAGWTSSIAFPIIEEKLELFNQDGKPFNLFIDEAGLNSNYQNFLDSFSYNSAGETFTSSLMNNNTDCGYTCSRAFVTVTDGYMHFACVEWRANSCPTGGGGGGYQTGGGGGGGTQPPPPTMRYVKRVHVRMGDGSTHEFRKSDGVFGYCSGSASDGPNCETPNPDNLGTFLAVDGSGLRLDRTAQGSTLYLPNGGRFLFPTTSTNGYDQTNLYQATKFIDSNGNQSHFSQTTVNNQNISKITDTLQREITDPLPKNLLAQTQNEGPQDVILPGLDGQSQNYKLNWLPLKPRGCETSTNASCGSGNGALENQAEKLFYYTATYCQGNLTPSTLPLTNTTNLDDPANEILFPMAGIGFRTCNPVTLKNSSGTNTTIPTRSNPVVLAEIELPNGKKYEFKYNQYGEITKIIYPSGSYETFKYSRISTINGSNELAYDQTNRGVTERKVYNSSGGLEQRWQYSAEYNNSDFTNLTYKITTIASKPNDPMANGIKTERLLHADVGQESDFGFSSPLTGMVKEERVYADDDYANPRSRTLTEWIVKGPVSTNDPLRPADSRAQRDRRVKRIVSVMIEGGQALATLSETQYDEATTIGNNAQTDPEYFSHLNAIRTKGYHYAVIGNLTTARTGSIDDIDDYFNNALPASISENEYIYNANYKNRGISSLLRKSKTLDPSSNAVLSESQIIYDNQLPAASPNYPAAYNTRENYGVSTTLNCSTDPQNPNPCWENQNTAYLGSPTTSRVWNKDNDTWIELHTRYDIFGNAIKSRDPIGNETETIYENSTTKPYFYAYPTKVIAPAPGDGTYGTLEKSEATTSYDFMTGLSLTVTNLNDLTTSGDDQTTATEYDLMLRPKKVYPVNFVAPITETIYDDTALTVKVKKQIDAGNWDEATTFMDSLGRTKKTVAKDSQGDVIVETKYDKLGRVTAVSNPYRQGDTVYWSKTRYDELGRAVESYAPALENETGASLGTTSFSISNVTDFVGTVVTTTDASLRKSRSITNALGQLLRVDEPTAIGGTTTDPNADIGPLNNPTQPTYYKYDNYGKMVRVQQGKTGETIQNRYFKYDSLGRLIRVNQPEQEINGNLNLADNYNPTGHWTAGFVYDNVGNVKRATDASGVNIVYEYDKANRVTKRCYTKPNITTTATQCSQIDPGQLSENTPTVEYFYDGYGLSSQPPSPFTSTAPNYPKGKLTKVTNAVSETRYKTFDHLGRLTEMEQRTPIGSELPSAATPRVSKYAYNLSGALTEETYPSTRVVKHEFESDGDLMRIYGKANTNAQERTYANSFSYTADGKIASLKLGNGLWESAKFNTRLQLTELALGHSVNEGSLWKVNYAYGELAQNGTDVEATKNTGNIAKQTISFNGLAQDIVQAYRYDSLYRLKEAKETSGNSQTWIQQHNYDRFGNRERAGSHEKIGAVVTAQDKKTFPTINQADNRFETGQGYIYDKNGNVKADVVDAVNLQTRDFIFDGENKQTEVKQNGATIGKYYYDGEGKRVKKELYSNGAVSETTIFVYSNGKLIAEYSTATPPTSPTTSYTATDKLGSPRVITDSFGAVVSRRDFMPFGEEIQADGTIRTSAQKYGAADSVRQRFTGYQKDIETGLDFAEARMYNNQHGRFTAIDPLLASGKSTNPQTFNRYSYVMNSPLRFTDPSGLQAGWAYRGINGGTEFTYLSDIAQTNKIADTEFGKQSEFVPYKQWLGGNFAIYADKTAERLNSDGTKTPFSLAVFDEPTWNRTVEEFTAGAFSTDVAETLEDLANHQAMRDREAEELSFIHPRSSAKNAGMAAREAVFGAEIKSNRLASSDGTFQRLVSTAELKATQSTETALLRGGREGINFFTNAASLDAKRGQIRLGLDGPLRDARITFRILDSNRVFGPQIAKPGQTGTPGGGVEFFTTGKTQIEILRIDQLKK